ncbi:MAG: hypothetical protein AB1696_29380, partial [Planctomycetota bacterium]
MSDGTGSFHEPFGPWGAGVPPSGRGWRSFSNLHLDVSSFQAGDLTDSLVDVAARRLGEVVTDALVVIDESVYDDERLKGLFDSIADADPARRRSILSLAADRVNETKPPSRTN